MSITDVFEVLDLVPYILIILVIALMIGVVGWVTVALFTNEATVVITEEEVEVTHLDITSTYSKSFGTRTYYWASVTNENISISVKISVEEYASLKVGDTVTLVTKTTTNTKFDDTVEYSIAKKEAIK